MYTRLCVVAWDPFAVRYGFSRLSTQECNRQDTPHTHTHSRHPIVVYFGCFRKIKRFHSGDSRDAWDAYRPKFVGRRRRWYTYEFRMIFQLHVLPFEVRIERRRALTWFFHTLISDTIERLGDQRSQFAIRFSCRMTIEFFCFCFFAVAILFLSDYEHTAHTLNL